jgi:uncharacterized protein
MEAVRVWVHSFLACALFGVTWVGFQTAQAASFNCSNALNLVESLICKDSSLSNKDSQMASLYKKVISDLPKSMQYELRDEQHEWLIARNSCENIECLELLYSKRIYDLKHNY